MSNQRENNPLVSVIVTTYNRQELLKETINSILEQSYKNFELIVVDNFSDYDFPNYIKTFNDSRIKAFQNQNNGVISVNRNYGIKKAKCSFISFCDDDDLWFPKKLKIQVDILIQNPDLLLISTNAETFPNGHKNMLFLRKDKQINIENLLKSNKIITSSVLLRSSVIDKVGCFDENSLLVAMEDYDLWIRILKFKDESCFILKKPLVKYRLHTQNISLYNNESKIGHYDKLLYILKKYPQYISSKKIDFIKENKDYLNQLLVIKRAYYRGQITMKYLFKNKTVHFKDKLLIAIKKPILHFLQQIP